MFQIPPGRVFRVKNAKYYVPNNSACVLANATCDSGLYRIDCFVRQLRGEFISYKYTLLPYPPYEEAISEPCTEPDHSYTLIKTEGLCEMARTPIYAVESPRAPMPTRKHLHKPNAPAPPEIDLVAGQTALTWLLFRPDISRHAAQTQR